MSTMKSFRLAFIPDQDRGADDHPSALPLWLTALIVVVAVAVVVGLADLHMLPSFAADDAGSILFSGG